MEGGEGSNLSAEFTIFACNHTTHHGYKGDSEPLYHI